MWGIEGCVDPAPPWVLGCFVHPRQFEIERLPISVEYRVKEHLFPADFHGEGNAVRGLAPVGLGKLHAVPRQVRSAKKLCQTNALALRLQVSKNAARVEVCLFDEKDPQRELRRVALPERTARVWHGYVPGLRPGALYGVRAWGPYEPAKGLRFNGNKLLVDPYARALTGSVDFKQPIFAYRPGDGDGELDDRDSAAGMPRCVVMDGHFDWEDDAPPRTPWHRSVIYEVHVRGFFHGEDGSVGRFADRLLGSPAIYGHKRT